MQMKGFYCVLRQQCYTLTSVLHYKELYFFSDQSKSNEESGDSQQPSQPSQQPSVQAAIPQTQLMLAGGQITGVRFTRAYCSKPPVRQMMAVSTAVPTELSVKVIVISFNIGTSLSERGDGKYLPTRKKNKQILIFGFCCKVFALKKKKNSFSLFSVSVLALQ